MHRLQVEDGFLSPTGLTNSAWPHLVGRFFRSLRSQRLTDSEVEKARSWLRPEESVAFFAQPAVDQRHGYGAALTVSVSLSDRTDLIRAALLHDIGKRQAGLGTLGRSFVTGLATLRIAAPIRRSGGRADLYLRHGVKGADELEALGAEQVVVDFARHHHGVRPASIGPDVWQVLQAADR